MNPSKMTVQQIKSRLGQLQAESRALNAALSAATMRESGLSVGDILIEYEGFRIRKEDEHATGRRGRLEAFDGRGYGWAVVRLLKKDGTAGARQATFCVWRKAGEADDEKLVAAICQQDTRR